MKLKFVTLSTLLVLGTTNLITYANAAENNNEPPMIGANNDSPSHPLGDKQNALKLKAIEAKLNGKTSGPVKEVAKGQFVELERLGEDSIWTSHCCLWTNRLTLWHSSIRDPRPTTESNS